VLDVGEWGIATRTETWSVSVGVSVGALDETDDARVEKWSPSVDVGIGCAEMGVMSAHSAGFLWSESHTSKSLGSAPKLSLRDPCSGGARTKPSAIARSTRRRKRRRKKTALAIIEQETTKSRIRVAKKVKR